MFLPPLRSLVRRLAGPSRRGRSGEARVSFRPELLRLEDRLAPAIVVWDGGPQGTGTNWNDPGNWVGNRVPGRNDDALIDANFAGVTIVSSQNVTIHSVTSEAALQIAGGTFSIATDSVIDNDVLLTADPALPATTLAFAGTLTVSGAYTQTDGSTTLLVNGTLNVNFVDIQGGLLTGAGTITGDVQNAGTISLSTFDPAQPNIGTLNIQGNYTQTASGVLNVKIAGTGSDVLNVGGTATLDGTLNIVLINQFTPQTGDVFVPLSFGNRSGDFANVNGLTINDHQAFDPSFDDNNLFLTVIAV
jgi:hypothetical protein